MATVPDDETPRVTYADQITRLMRPLAEHSTAMLYQTIQPQLYEMMRQFSQQITSATVRSLGFSGTIARPAPRLQPTTRRRNRVGRPESPLHLQEVIEACRALRSRGEKVTQETLNAEMCIRFGVCVSYDHFKTKIRNLTETTGCSWNDIKRA